MLTVPTIIRLDHIADGARFPSHSKPGWKSKTFDCSNDLSEFVDDHDDEHGDEDDHGDDGDDDEEEEEDDL